ncbi:MAG: hypothetical protein OEV41_06435, partial [Gammaproteobacteria bacterium]|nr:hypothetical protein [Gammaproteobacteria bacterium]
ASLIAACGTTQTVSPPVPEDVVADTEQLTYDAIAVRIETPFDANLEVGIEGKGEATREGLAMLAAAPLGCLQGGAAAGLCMVMAPFFPFIAAARAEDPDVSLAELEAFYERFEQYGIHEKLAARINARLAEEQVPVAGGDDPDNERLTLSVRVEPLELEHSGYKDGSIDVTMRYTVALTDASGAVLARRSDSAYRYFTESTRSATLYPQLDEWLDRVVDLGVRDMLVNWQPTASLANVYPVKEQKRSLLGFRYFEWSPVQTTAPRLAWAGLETALPADTMAGISNVRYEVDVWAMQSATEPGGYWTRRYVRRIRGLDEPAAVIESGLRPCQRYYWQPRARFTYAGAVRTVSSTEQYELIVQGEGCKHPAYSMSRYEFDAEPDPSAPIL